MDKKKREALESKGWKFGDAADFLGMSDAERQLLDVRVRIANAIRQLRKDRHLTQEKLGDLLKTSQPRVAKIESAAEDVSLDQLLRAYLASGGSVSVTSAGPQTTPKKKAGGKKPTKSSSVGTAQLTLELKKTGV